MIKPPKGGFFIEFRGSLIYAASFSAVICRYMRSLFHAFLEKLAVVSGGKRNFKKSWWLHGKNENLKGW